MAINFNVQGKKNLLQQLLPWESDFCTMEILYKMF